MRWWLAYRASEGYSMVFTHGKELMKMRGWLAYRGSEGYNMVFTHGEDLLRWGGDLRTVPVKGTRRCSHTEKNYWDEVVTCVPYQWRVQCGVHTWRRTNEMRWWLAYRASEGYSMVFTHGKELMKMRGWLAYRASEGYNVVFTHGEELMKWGGYLRTVPVKGIVWCSHMEKN